MKQQSLTMTIFFNTAGIFLYMVGIKVFAAPAGIAPGGASGIAVLVNYNGISHRIILLPVQHPAIIYYFMEKNIPTIFFL